jgi:putative intracellular protease/amidase
MKILMVLTSHDKLGDTGRKTGFWLEELAAPYYEFKDVGAQITLASPKGGRPPLDPKSQVAFNGEHTVLDTDVDVVVVAKLLAKPRTGPLEFKFSLNRLSFL